jgi:uncharacterized membrane protein
LEIEKIIKWLIHNKGKTLGAVLGLIFSLFIIEYGFFKTFFVSICIIAGYYIGKHSDKSLNWKNIFSGRSDE